MFRLTQNLFVKMLLHTHALCKDYSSRVKYVLIDCVLTEFLDVLLWFDVCDIFRENLFVILAVLHKTVYNCINVFHKQCYWKLQN